MGVLATQIRPGVWGKDRMDPYQISGVQRPNTDGSIKRKSFAGLTLKQKWAAVFRMNRERLEAEAAAEAARRDGPGEW